jgi:hypothetical protein
MDTLIFRKFAVAGRTCGDEVIIELLVESCVGINGGLGAIR